MLKKNRAALGAVVIAQAGEHADADPSTLQKTAAHSVEPGTLVALD